MADEPKKGEPRPLVVDFWGLELRDGDSVTFDVPQGQAIRVFPPDEGLEFYHGFAGYSRVERRAGAAVYIRIPPTIEGEATRIAGELPAPEGEGDGSV